VLGLGGHSVHEQKDARLVVGQVVNHPADEFFVVTLSAASGATISDEQGTPVRNWTFDAGLGELAPGRSASFREVVRDAPATPLRVNLTFAETVASR
jgi:hypothetical protein